MSLASLPEDVCAVVDEKLEESVGRAGGEVGEKGGATGGGQRARGHLVPLTVYTPPPGRREGGREGGREEGEGGREEGRREGEGEEGEGR